MLSLNRIKQALMLSAASSIALVAAQTNTGGEPDCYCDYSDSYSSGTMTAAIVGTFFGTMFLTTAITIWAMNSARRPVEAMRREPEAMTEVVTHNLTRPLNRL